MLQSYTATCPRCKVMREEILKGAFVDSLNILYKKYSDWFQYAIDEAFSLMDPTVPEEEIKAIRVKLAKESEKRQKLMGLLISDKIDEKAYGDRVALIDGKIVSLKNRISHCEEKALEIDKRRRGLTALKNLVDKGEIITQFDPLAFEELVQNMIIGGYDEAGNVDPFRIMIVLKSGEKHLLTGRNYVPQRKNAAARNYPLDYTDNGFIEIFNFTYYGQYFEFEKSSMGMRKIPRGSVPVKVVIPINIEETSTETTDAEG